MRLQPLGWSSFDLILYCMSLATVPQSFENVTICTKISTSNFISSISFLMASLKHCNTASLHANSSLTVDSCRSCSRGHMGYCGHHSWKCPDDTRHSWGHIERCSRAVEAVARLPLEGIYITPPHSSYFNSHSYICPWLLQNAANECHGLCVCRFLSEAHSSARKLTGWPQARVLHSSHCSNKKAASCSPASSSNLKSPKPTCRNQLMLSLGIIEAEMCKLSCRCL